MYRLLDSFIDLFKVKRVLTGFPRLNPVLPNFIRLQLTSKEII